MKDLLNYFKNFKDFKGLVLILKYSKMSTFTSSLFISREML